MESAALSETSPHLTQSLRTACQSAANRFSTSSAFRLAAAGILSSNCSYRLLLCCIPFCPPPASSFARSAARDASEADI